jgi:hypothetical protein
MARTPHALPRQQNGAPLLNLGAGSVNAVNQIYQAIRTKTNN